MKFCSHCGKEVLEDAVICPNCGCSVGPVSSVEDVNSTGLNVLSFFFPLVGLILYLVFRDKTPIRAKGVGKWALIGFIVGCVLTLIQAVAIPLLLS